jgi:hypothetical protein
MMHAEMEGKEPTLFAEVREIEKAIELLLQVLESGSPKTAETQPHPPSQCAAEQKMMDMIHRLKTCRRQVVEAKQVIETLVRIIGE